jgi:hypothetical protein
VGPRLKFTHGSGSSSGWIFFATPAGTHQRYILKVQPPTRQQLLFIYYYKAFMRLE